MLRPDLLPFVVAGADDRRKLCVFLIPEFCSCALAGASNLSKTAVRKFVFINVIGRSGIAGLSDRLPSG